MTWQEQGNLRRRLSRANDKRIFRHPLRMVKYSVCINGHAVIYIRATLQSYTGMTKNSVATEE